MKLFTGFAGVVGTWMAACAGAIAQPGGAMLPQPTLPAEVMTALSDARVRRDIDRLAAFGTRHTLSDPDSPTRGIGAARNWIKAELEAASKAGGGRMTVEFQSFDAPPSQRIPRGGTVVNVVARLPGTAADADRRLCYVVAHYDSRCAEVLDSASDAPGANDDGSGTAAVIEIARALANQRLASTVVFLLTAGEEQSLVGSRHHADQLGPLGPAAVRGVLNNDIIGDPLGPDSDPARATPGLVRVFSEGLPRNPTPEQLTQIRSLASENDSPSRQLARYVADVARRERTTVQPMLVFRLDRFLRGGDHTPFLERGFPAVRFTEVDEDYSRQHADVRDAAAPDGTRRRTGDLPELVDAAYVANVARLNAAVLVHLANAPAAPARVRIITAQLDTSTELRWDADSTGEAAGYEVMWRATTAPDWEQALDVGLKTAARLQLNKDNVFLGVRAYDRAGYRSPVTFAAAAKE